jgi:hypothetical protein
MRKDLISKYKSDILAKRRKGKKKGGRPATSAAAAKPQAGPAPKAAKNGARGILMEDVLAVKALVQRVGPTQLRTLIDALTR